jgi:hypothetical protein
VAARRLQTITPAVAERGRSKALASRRKLARKRAGKGTS